MADETGTTGEVARVLEFGRAWYEATVAYHRAVEEAFRPLLEMGREDCGSCAACDPGLQLGGDDPIWFASRMNVCPDCGNKRCPKAGDHAKWQCSGSNETGQEGVPVAAGRPEGGSAGRGASGGLDGALVDACGAKSEPFLIRDSDQKPIHYLVKTCHLPAGHGRPHHWPVLTFVTPGFTEEA